MGRVEDWVGNQNKGLLQESQNWEDIETAIKDLDGRRKTLVTLETDGETHMAIGGQTGKYVVYVTFDNENFYNLVDLSKSNAPDEFLVVGGQEGIYPAKLCVDLNTVLQAAKTFALLGKLEKSVIWEQEGVVERV